ncbi:phosphatase PAP2 family protein [Silvibacterium dinghuense]|uniref:Phosphatase PAP2 family protein n=2 Tax=Silvibacterium dinghuense TaxID=1560006 RepID=A0A4Q1SL32_9BACT|nr:phosphatase PAP2 family protein [Silvibacterium dinghuense]
MTAPAAAPAPSKATLEDLRGLAPVSALSNSEAGQAALAGNLTTTGDIQTGEIRQPTLLPFASQQQLALADVFAPGHNLGQLADGLGTTLGAAYLTRFHPIDREHATPLPPAVARLVDFAVATTGYHSNAAKFFFGNGTTDGKTPISPEAQAIYTEVHGSPDPFGRAYHLAAGSPGSDPYGDSRPFQTEPVFTHYMSIDYFHDPATNDTYNRGPLMDLTGNPSYPSGHTTYGYTGSLLLALLVPSRYQQMVARGAEYGNDRIIVGAHYAMDVLGGRALALHDMAHLLANDPAYVKDSPSKKMEPIGDFQAALKAARAELAPILETACGDRIDSCAAQDISRFSHPAADSAFYESTQNYNIAIAHPETVNKIEDVGKLAPEAGYLLTAAFPGLSLEEADRILTETEGPGGGFLDDGSSFGVYSRIDLYAAAGVAAQRTSK